MPFTVNVGPYQGGNFLMQGLGNLGEGVGKAIAEHKDQERTAAYNDMIVQNALNNGEISLEDFTKYRAMGHSAKTGYAAGIAANFVENLKREQMEGLREQRLAQAELRKQQAEAFNWTPDEAAQAAAEALGGKLLPTGPGKYNFEPYGDAAGGITGEPQILPFKNPITNEPVPGFGIVRQPGGKQFQVVQFGTDEPVFGVDDDTGAIYKRDAKGHRVAPTLNEIMALRMQGVNVDPNTGKLEKKKPETKGEGKSSLDSIWDYIKNFKPGPQSRIARRQAAATPTATPAGDARAAATAYLQAHGLPVTEANIKHYIDASQSQ